MQAFVNRATCIGCGLCADISPSVFSMRETVAEAILSKVPADLEEACRNAAQSCPLEAIELT
jgi:ferredoxin